jgi:hypothetical protein
MIMSQDVVNSALSEKTPKAFTDLKKPELLKAAARFGTSTEGGVAELRADLVEAGVTWDMYREEFLPDAPVEPVVDVVLPPGPDVSDTFEEVQEPVVETIATVSPTLELPREQKYLVKFIGENPYFEHGKYKFSEDRPYQIMTAQDAQYALVNEPKKFRQAFPNELEEFYK